MIVRLDADAVDRRDADEDGFAGLVGLLARDALGLGSGLEAVAVVVRLERDRVMGC